MNGWQLKFTKHSFKCTFMLTFYAFFVPLYASSRVQLQQYNFTRDLTAV